MKPGDISKLRFLKPALGATFTVLAGLILWGTPVGDGWSNASYDYLFRFGSRAVTNQVALILMDNEAYDQYHQTRGQPWDRALHARLLDRLANDGCALVVFDSFFGERGRPGDDTLLADSMRRAKHVALMAKQVEVMHPAVEGVRPMLPAELFLNAAGANWGVAWLDTDLDLIVRRHWPFPSPGPHPSLSWVAARLAGAQLDEAPQKRWLRYYGQNGRWTSMSYGFAFTQPANFFRNKVVFIGNKPNSTLAGGEPDKFSTPYSRWTGETTGGTEILATEFLNLMNRESLVRPPMWIEATVVIAAGLLLGVFFCQVRRLTACGFAVLAALVAALGAVCLSYASNCWFPGLVIAGGQVPCALAWALVAPVILRQRQSSIQLAGVGAASAPNHELPDTPDYELFNPPFGEGAYGKVWLARNAIGQWQALKAVYRAKFGPNAEPYEREFNGIRSYKPLSDKHPGLLRVDFVSRPAGAGYFYYVMELGDALMPGWELNPPAYLPCDLASLRSRTEGRRLPVSECVRIGVALADALVFLHNQGLTHCDIKPQNIIFVNGHPKLADIGLVSQARSAGDETSSLGTPGYMPPSPEPSGTPQADIYGLGMVLYVIRTGFQPPHFPEISATLVEKSEQVDFAPLNAVILKACHPDCGQRFASMAQMREALTGVQNTIVRATKPT